MATQYKYTVTLTEEAGSPYPLKGKTTEIKTEAINTAEKWAKENPDKLVFIEFYRSNDGQKGYINKDGAGISGTSWTE
ncbi:hypothetical protein MXL46_08090 [Heyndrickxia sporothermodurans]|uniref:hypothetical protein n=1 Tax=Heyndrickxia sporothermodurans TaxID=46224 RepID=UPI002DBB91A7|nr:hypothetical protein [Heyndrickxia sporothermodurans]MEB6549054.1 hypothetical protein [Heyndrickxia sporothermodurans]